uniref:Uncharacterized protein n=1 Tax=Panagrolaimus davidi TaxID=227884 RepID=A0A914QIC0_9BILA
MESLNFQRASSVLSRKTKEEENVKAKNFCQLNLRSKYISSCSPQSFSLPDSIIFYISKNPTTSKLYQKMILTCKYFFIKNPVIVSSSYSYSRDLDKCCIEKIQFDLSQLICKYWITENFDSTSILPKLYKCDARKVNLINKVISFKDLSMFATFAEDITLETITVKDSNGSILPFEKVFEAFINAKKYAFYFYLTLPEITSKTFNELLKIPHFSKLQSMNLNSVPETFDIEAFYVYMKKNKTTKFNLLFDDSISQVYKNRLEEIIDEILSTKFFNYAPPFIDFDGLEYEKSFRLFDLFYDVTFP